MLKEIFCATCSIFDLSTCNTVDFHSFFNFVEKHYADNFNEWNWFNLVSMYPINLLSVSLSICSTQARDRVKFTCHNLCVNQEHVLTRIIVIL